MFYESALSHYLGTYFSITMPAGVGRMNYPMNANVALARNAYMAWIAQQYPVYQTNVLTFAMNNAVNNEYIDLGIQYRSRMGGAWIETVTNGVAGAWP